MSHRGGLVAVAVAAALVGSPGARAAPSATSTPTPTPTPTSTSTSTSTSTPTSTSTAGRPLPPQATPREVRSRLTKAQPRLGEPFDWEIELRHSPAESYALPASPTLDPFRVAPLGCRRAAAGQDSITTCALRLTLFELGPHQLPTLRLEAASPQGPRILDVPGPLVEGAGVIDPAAPADQLQLRDPAAPVPLLLPTWRPAWLALGALAALALAWLAWRAWRRRAARATEPPPPLAPGERFGRRLDALEAERLPEQGRVREYFFRLSEAVREYVGALTGVNALDLTTAELVDVLRAQGDPRLDVEALRGFAEDADLVKFARFPAGGYECDAGMSYARQLLARTWTPAPTSVAAPNPTSVPPPPPHPSSSSSSAAGPPRRRG